MLSARLAALCALAAACSVAAGEKAPGRRGHYRYDFGSARAAPVKGYVRVGIGDAYTAEKGYGLVPSKGKAERGWRCRGVHKDRRLDSFVFDGGGLTFRQDLSNGDYLLTLASGDAQYSGRAEVKLSGAIVAPSVTTRANEFLAIDRLEVAVRTGQLKVQVGGLGRLNFLEILPAASAPRRDPKAKAVTVWRFAPRAPGGPPPPVPKGEWAIGRDGYGPIVRVNLNAIKDWTKVPGIKKRWEARGPGGERRCYIPVTSAIKDVDGDGRLDVFSVIIRRPYAQLARFDYDGRELWRSDKLAPCAGDESGLPVRDLDGDGTLECVLSQWACVYCISARTGRTKWKAELDKGGKPGPGSWDYPMVVGHFPSDKRKLGVVVRAGLRVHCFGPDGKALWTHPLKGHTYGHELDRYDVDGDGYDEIFVGRNGNVTALAHDGHLLWEDNTQRNHTDFFAFGDIDGDGRTEAVYDHDGCGGRGPLYVVDALTGKRKLTIDYRRHGLPHAQALACGDFRPDLPGLEIALDDKRAMLLLFDARGELLWKRDVPTSLLARGDWDGDGAADILVFTIGVNVDPAFSVWNGWGKRLFAMSWLPAPVRSHAIVAAPCGGFDGLCDLDGNGRCDVLTGFGPWTFGSPQNLFLLEAPRK